MSGGSHNYIYYKIEDELAGRMHDKELDDLMTDVAKLAHDLEWMDSGDISEKGYKNTVKKFKNKWFKSDRNERLKDYIDKSLEDLKIELYQLIGGD